MPEPKPVKLKEYRTLEMDLMDCFTKRKIEVLKILVEEEASLYTIKVKRS